MVDALRDWTGAGSVAGWRMEFAAVTCPTCFEVFEVAVPHPDELPAEGKISVRGVFMDDELIRANEYHVNDTRYRELASVFGLAIVAIYWLIVLSGRIRGH